MALEVVASYTVEAEASTFYAGFVERVRRSYVPDRVSDGIFGAMMRVQLENDGPVTLCLDSRA
eukprot:jgi/Pico_ML_1/54833/g693.t2